MRFYTLILIGLISFGKIDTNFAQKPHFKIEQLPNEIGWTNNAINDILQDHRGFLWMATWSGLAKYDGYSVKMYRQTIGETEGLKSNKVTCLFEDSKGRLWVGTNYTGFYLYDREKDNFIQFSKSAEDMNSLSNNNVWAISEDQYGYLWIGTQKGLNRFDLETGKFVHYEKSEGDDRSLSYDFVYSFAQIKDGDFWIGCEIGLNRLIRKEDGTPDYFIRYSLAPDGVSEDDFLRHNFIRTLHLSKSEPNTLWAGTSIGLKKITWSDDQLSKIDYQTYYHDLNNSKSLSHGFVSNILEDDAGERAWVATYDGLNVLDNQTGNFRHLFSQNQPNSLSNNVVKTLFKDRSGVLWIGTEKGVNNINLNAKPFKNIQFSEDNNIVSCIIQSQYREGLWVGTMGGGLVFLPIKNGETDEKNIRQYKFSNVIAADLAGFISDLKVDKNGWLWISTQGAGILKIRESDIPEQSTTLRNVEQFNKENKLADDYVMSLLETESGEIWLGYWDDGVDRYDATTNSFQHFSHTEDYSLNLQEFPVVHINEVMENGESYIWIGTRGGGVAKLKYDKANGHLELIEHYEYENGKLGGLSNNTINCFYQYEEEKLWIGTENGLNLLNLKTDSFAYFLEKDGFANGIIQSILGDENGGLWVSTQKGISSVHKENGNVEIKNFDAYDGLQGNFFYDESACQLPNGQLVFGGVNGLNIFNPSEIRADSTPPQVVITDFRLFNNSVQIGKSEGRTILEKNISETQSVHLTHRDNVISIEFVGLQFGEPQKIQYAHKLQGFDPDWVYTDASQRIAHYTNLPYETFQFKVKAANGDGIWSEPIGFELTVAPPFWLTNWAFLIYALLFVALIYGVRYITKMRAEFQHNLELEKLEREKSEAINQMKLRFFTNISHELRTPLTLIISPLEQFIREQNFEKKLHKSFTRMHHNANRLLTMINQLLDIRKSEAGLMNLKVVESDIVKFTKEVVLSFKPLAKQRNIKLTFQNEEEKILHWFDRGQMEKVLFNLLSNAFKFTKEGGKITIKIERNEAVLISVKDTGKGIAPENLTNIFDRFFQVESNRDGSESVGTGIGLALSKSIIEKHHGKIWAESELGEGSTFYITLPKGETHFSEIERVKDYIGSEHISNYVLFSLENGDAQISDTAKASNTSPSKASEKPALLIVEDNSDIRSYLKENLEANYKVTEAADGVEGLEKALADPPNLIIADISMPRMDGIELCRKVKSDINTSHIPIILLTARTSLIFKIDGLETGADDYITKPFNMQLLKTRVKNLIQSRKKLHEKFAKNFDLTPTNLVLHSLDEKLLAQIKIIVGKHIDDSDFSVEQLATALHMSRMQLYRKLKALTGKSPNKIIRTIRLKHAAQLLKTKQYNVSDVTYMVGYNDLKSFREQFKKEFGVSPSGYV